MLQYVLVFVCNLWSMMKAKVLTRRLTLLFSTKVHFGPLSYDDSDFNAISTNFNKLTW